MSTDPEAEKLKQETERIRLTTQADNLKTVVTFGAFAIVVFCVAGPVVLAFAPDLSRCFRETAIALSGAAGFLIVVGVGWFTYRTLCRESVRDSTACMPSEKNKQGNTNGQ